MTVRIFRNTDFGAPAMQNAAGDFVAVADACLINGYGSQTITLTRTGSTVTATTTSPHGLLKTAKYTVAGADQAEYNGEFSIIVTGASSFTYEIVGTPVSPATGTITGSLASAGWSTQFTAANKRVYQQGGVNNGFSLRIDDTATNNARVVCYESMSDIDTGVNATPTNVQVAGGGYWAKHSAAVDVDWFILATEEFMFYGTRSSTTVDNDWQIYYYGDFASKLAGDSYNTAILISTTTSPTSSSHFQAVNSLLATTSIGHYYVRDYTQLISSLQHKRVR